MTETHRVLFEGPGGVLASSARSGIAELYSYLADDGETQTPHVTYTATRAYAVMTLRIERRGDNTTGLLALIEYMASQDYQLVSHSIWTVEGGVDGYSYLNAIFRA